MAHFAKIEDDIVVHVIVIDNEDTLDELGEESEAVGIAFCTNLLGGVWVKTSYNSNIRKKYAGIGDTYDIVRDSFIRPSPYPSWVLNEDTYVYEAPTPYPSEEERGVVGTLWNETGSDSRPYYQTMSWDESSLSWVNDVIPEEVILV